MIAKQIQILENRLDKALVRYNGVLGRNKDLRSRIDELRRERVVFDGMCVAALRACRLLTPTLRQPPICSSGRNCLSLTQPALPSTRADTRSWSARSTSARDSCAS